MYCPRCGTQNEAKQRYCRQCGQPLSTVYLALDGSLDESIEKFKRGGDSLTGGIVTFGIFLFIAAIAYKFGGIWASAIDIILGLVISTPMIIKGIVTLQKAELKLKSEKASGAKEIESGRTTDKMKLQLSSDNSVTEDTTLQLRAPTKEQ